MIALTREPVPLIGCSVASSALACGRAFNLQVYLHKVNLSSMHSVMNHSPTAASRLPTSLHSRYYIHPDIQVFHLSAR